MDHFLQQKKCYRKKIFIEKRWAASACRLYFQKDPVISYREESFDKAPFFPYDMRTRNTEIIPPFKISAGITISKISYTSVANVSLSKSVFTTLQNGCRENSHLVDIYSEIQPMSKSSHHRKMELNLLLGLLTGAKVVKKLRFLYHFISAFDMQMNFEMKKWLVCCCWAAAASFSSCLSFLHVLDSTFKTIPRNHFEELVIC